MFVLVNFKFIVGERSGGPAILITDSNTYMEGTPAVADNVNLILLTALPLISQN